MKKTICAAGTLLLSGLSLAAPLYPIHILAAENFYGDVAKSIGGNYVAVTSVLTAPGEDPHFLNLPPQLDLPQLNEQIGQARLIIENGAGYDSWMDVLYNQAESKAYLLNVAIVTHLGSNFNPHIWYNPAAMPLFAEAVASQLIKIDPDPVHDAAYQRNLRAFLNMSNLYQARVNKVMMIVNGKTVTATEPIANALLTALGLQLENIPFQLAMMNNAKISPEERQAFQVSLQNHAITLLVYNQQVTDAMTAQLKATAIQYHIPVVGVNEMLPAGMHYYAWMNQALFAIRDALTGSQTNS